MYQIIRHLAPNHELHLLCFVPSLAAGTAMEPLRAYCTITTVPAPVRTARQRLATTLFSRLPDMLWRGRSAQFRSTLRQLLAAQQFDVVQAESIEMTQYGLLPQHRNQQQGPLWVYDSFNVEYMIQERAAATDLGHFPRWPKAGYSAIQWQKLQHWEQSLRQRWNGAFAVSEGDQALLTKLNPGLQLAVVPNGVDTDYFLPQRQPSPLAPTVLFSGTLNYRANVDALLWFCAEVWPHVLVQQPHAHFAVVGRDPVPDVQRLAQIPSVEIIGEVDDVRPFFSTAAVYVVPMRVGGGVRLKVLEAWAQRVPVVSTSLGVDGIGGFVPEVHAWVRDDPISFAQAVVQLLTTQEIGRQLGLAGRTFVVANYDWRAIVPRIPLAWTEWSTRRTAAPLRHEPLLP